MQRMDFVFVISFAALLVGLAKGGLGPVPGALLTPLLTTIMPVSDAIGLALPLLLVGDLLALRVYWRQWDSRALRLTLPGAAAGAVMGIALLAVLSDFVLRRILGAFTVGIVVYKAASEAAARTAYTPRRWHGTLAGWGSGFGSALANTGAPPITAYLLLQGMTPVLFVGTTLVFFTLLDVIKLPGFLAAGVIDAQQLAGIVWALPLIPLGIWLGKRLVDRIDPRAFERLMLALLFGAGLLLFG
jgi:uncharacterized membrane protein YfcA